MKKIIFFWAFLWTSSAYAYPQFIGYKYNTCLTCHFNSQGSGQLNDYGRALWATEIAGRAFVKDMSVESLGEMSRFLGKKQLPWWIRLGAKFRQIWIRSNPTRSTAQSRDILMQADMNVALFTSQSQRFGFISTFGYAGEELQQLNEFTGRGDSAFISREHYFRWQTTDSLWLYLGKMDKVYGIRHANHTAYSRARNGLSQNDQAHGLVAHYIKSNWELSLNVFAGDLTQEEEFQEQGASVMFEYDLKDNLRLGVSTLVSETDSFERSLVGFHSKSGLGHGVSFLNEVGLISSASKLGSNPDDQIGYYLYSEAMQKIIRGYHVFATAQAFKNDMKGEVPDSLRLGMGFLIFPLQRFEFRFDVENTRSLSSGAEVREDAWAFYGQVHLSL